MTIASNVQAVLDRMHAQAAGDRARWAARAGDDDADALAAAQENALIRMGELYLSVSPDEGRMLYMLALKSNAQHVVEFGASFGVSTLYLASAMVRTGGHVTTTEVHPEKCAALRATFAEAGLADHITLLEGDARKTLADTASGVDFLVLDGWKGMYRPIFDLLRPKLAPGAWIAADNVDHDAAQPFLAFAQSDPGLMTAVTGDMALSMVLG